MDIALEARHLVKRYPGVLAVNDLSFSVPDGVCFGLLGPNGAGKTTTVEIIEGVSEPTSGEVWYRGSPAGRRFREEVGIQFQNTALQDHLRVGETLRMFQQLYNRRGNLDHIIEQCALGDLLDRDNRKLSGGQRQRLLLAVALVNEPRIVFLDEPTTGLDPQARVLIWKQLQALKREGKTLLLTTHYMDEAQRLCDRVAIVDHGEVIADGTPAKLIASLGGEHLVQLTFEAQPADLEVFSRLNTVSAVRQEEQELTLTVAQLHIAIPEILEVVKRENLALGSLTTHQATLEDVFVELAGRSLSEES